MPFELRDVVGYPTTDFGWPVVPDALREWLIIFRARYRAALPPIMITESGCAYNMGPDEDGVVDDQPRIDYLHAHLTAVARGDRARRRRPRLLLLVAAGQLRVGRGPHPALRAGARRLRHAASARPSAPSSGTPTRSPPSPGAGPLPDRVRRMSSRRVVFVVGSGRSGTSTMSGTLQTLGLHVPQPEVAADATNPKGFGEPQWVVDLHTELLARSNVQVSDARPRAWLDAGRLSGDHATRERVTAWLESQFAEGDELVVKDPRASWFLGLWRACADRCDATSSYITMLRPVTEVVGSKKQYYDQRQGDVTRTAAWVNMMLHTERATRGEQRRFVRYADLLADWTQPVFAIGEAFDLHAVKTAMANDIAAGAQVHRPLAAPGDPHLGRRRGAGRAARARPGDLAGARRPGRGGWRHRARRTRPATSCAWPTARCTPTPRRSRTPPPSPSAGPPPPRPAARSRPTQARCRPPRGRPGAALGARDRPGGRPPQPPQGPAPGALRTPVAAHHPGHPLPRGARRLRRHVALVARRAPRARAHLRLPGAQRGAQPAVGAAADPLRRPARAPRRQRLDRRHARGGRVDRRRPRRERPLHRADLPARRGPRRRRAPRHPRHLGALADALLQLVLQPRADVVLDEVGRRHGAHARGRRHPARPGLAAGVDPDHRGHAAAPADRGGRADRLAGPVAALPRAVGLSHGSGLHLREGLRLGAARVPRRRRAPRPPAGPVRGGQVARRRRVRALAHRGRRLHPHPALPQAARVRGRRGDPLGPRRGPGRPRARRRTRGRPHHRPRHPHLAAPAAAAPGHPQPARLAARADRARPGDETRRRPSDERVLLRSSPRWLHLPRTPPGHR